MIPFAFAHFFPGFGFWVMAMGYSMSTSIQLATHGRLNSSRQKKQSSLWMPCSFLRLPCADSYIKLTYNLLAFVFQIFVEISMYNSSIVGADDEHIRAHNVTFWYKTGFYNVEYDLWEMIYRNRPHVIMYFGFALSAIVEILTYYGEPMPPKSDKAMMVIAFMIEGFVFSNHTHGRDHLDAHLHVFLAYAVYGCVIMTAIECWDDTNPLVHYGKSLCIFLQATWFFQIILMLYWPVDTFGNWTIFKWDLEDPRQIANLTFYFGLHVVFVLASLLLQYLIVRRYYAYRGWNIVDLNQIDDIESRRVCDDFKPKCRRFKISTEEDDTEFLLTKT